MVIAVAFHLLKPINKNIHAQKEKKNLQEVVATKARKKINTTINEVREIITLENYPTNLKRMKDPVVAALAFQTEKFKVTKKTRKDQKKIVEVEDAVLLHIPDDVAIQIKNHLVRNQRDETKTSNQRRHQRLLNHISRKQQ